MLPMFGRYSTMSTIYIIYLQMSQATQFWIILQISGVNWVSCRHLLQYSGVNYQSNFKGCILTKKIPNTAWVRVRLCKLQKGCFKRAAASDKVYQWLVHGRWFSPGTPAFSTTNTGRHDIAEILLKVALNTKRSIYQSILIIL